MPKDPKKLQAATAAKQLLSAAEEGDLAAVKAALAAGANVNAKAQHDMSPLLTACFNGFAEIAEALIGAGADTKARNRYDWTPLTMTVHGAAMAPENNSGVKSERNHISLLKFLLENGGNPNEKHDGETLLEMAEGDVYASPRPEKLIPILKKAGSRSRTEAEMLEEGDLEIFEPPDFSKAAKRPEFLAAVKDFTARFGKPIKDFGEFSEHIAVFETTRALAEKTVAEEQSKLLARGVFLCRVGDYHGEALGAHEAGGAAHLGLFPTGDVYEALAAVEVAGGAGGVPAALRRLREIAQDDPFKLTFISLDTLEGEFLAPPRDAAKLAERLDELCTEGEDDTTQLASRLKESRRLFLWWD
jgi:hypothetical protein